jgi:hypothetical protein
MSGRSHRQQWRRLRRQELRTPGGISLTLAFGSAKLLEFAGNETADWHDFSRRGNATAHSAIAANLKDEKELLSGSDGRDQTVDDLTESTAFSLDLIGK